MSEEKTNSGNYAVTNENGLLDGRDDDFGGFMIDQNPKLKAELDRQKAEAKKKPTPMFTAYTPKKPLKKKPKKKILVD